MHERKQLIALLLVALAARLIFLVCVGAPLEVSPGGDEDWYLRNGVDLVHASEAGPLHTGPGYLVLVGVVGSVLPRAAAIAAIKLLQVILGTLTVGLVYLLGRGVWSHRAGMVAGGAVALGLAFIADIDRVLTEPLFMFLFMAALAYYVWRAGEAAPRELAVVGALLGLAAMTRAVLLGFPAALVLHLALRRGWRRALRPAGMLLLAFALALAPWTVYNLARWNRFVIAGEGFDSFLFFGAQEEGWIGPDRSDAALGIDPDNPADRDYAGRAIDAIAADPVGWVALRLRNLTEASLQPHNTAYFPGESLKDAAARWLKEDRSLDGLAALTRAEAFWPKLILYLFHFVALTGGLAGVVMAARRWREAFVLYAALGYFLAVHLVLLALPRYLFPIEPVWWLFAASAMVGGWDALRRRSVR